MFAFEDLHSYSQVQVGIESIVLIVVAVNDKTPDLVASVKVQEFAFAAPKMFRIEILPEIDEE